MEIDCSKCGEIKHISCFSPDKKRKRGYGSYCRECRKKQWNDYVIRTGYNQRKAIQERSDKLTMKQAILILTLKQQVTIKYAKQPKPTYGYLG